LHDGANLRHFKGSDQYFLYLEQLHFSPTDLFISMKIELHRLYFASLRYRSWSLGQMADGTEVRLVCRTEQDGVTIGPNGDTQTLTIKAFNEWDSKASSGVDWRSKLDAQKGAVLATELQNNSCKLAKWTLQALLAGSDQIKFGYVSRANVFNSANHVILGTQQYKPTEFATNITLNLDNAWGILRCIVDHCMKQPPGKYLLFKDPNKVIYPLVSPPSKFQM
uniref:Eukaryotic translation initiation factor 3 subunit p66 n=1 Tax=Parascaris equorum TaxID=6256 RepID=A0A914RRA4_PAREQ